MLSLHTIENALLTLSFNYSTIRNATKCVDILNNGQFSPYLPVVHGNVTIRRGDAQTFVTVERIGDCGRYEYVYVLVPDIGEDYKTFYFYNS